MRDSHPRMNANCQQCGKPFRPRIDFVAKGGGKYCSRQCSGAADRKGDYHTCQQCGVSFFLSPAAVRQGRGNYCSEDCRKVAVRASVIPTPVLECEECGTTFSPNRHNWIRGYGKRCSARCNGIAIRRINAATLLDRFWARVDKSGECWIWIGARYKKGYGHFSIDRETSILATHFSWELVNGPISSGMMVCHDCPGGDDPRCVRVEHLFLGTAADNSADMVAKGRHTYGEINGNAVLTDAIVREARQRYRDRTSTMADMAREYGVHRGTLRCAIRGQTWAHVKP